MQGTQGGFQFAECVLVRCEERAGRSEKDRLSQNWKRISTDAYFTRLVCELVYIEHDRLPRHYSSSHGSSSGFIGPKAS